MIDVTLANRVMTALDNNPFVPGGRVHFEAEQGKVVLRGVVGSYYQKQMAQESLRRIEGVNHIENLLQVHWS